MRAQKVRPNYGLTAGDDTLQSTDCRLEIRKEIDKENNYFILNRKREPERDKKRLKLLYSRYLK